MRSLVTGRLVGIHRATPVPGTSKNGSAIQDENGVVHWVPYIRDMESSYEPFLNCGEYIVLVHVPDSYDVRFSNVTCIGCIGAASPER